MVVKVRIASRIGWISIGPQSQNLGDADGFCSDAGFMEERSVARLARGPTLVQHRVQLNAQEAR